jgi:hypothetical protein
MSDNADSMTAALAAICSPDPADDFIRGLTSIEDLKKLPEDAQTKMVSGAALLTATHIFGYSGEEIGSHHDILGVHMTSKRSGAGGLRQEHGPQSVCNLTDDSGGIIIDGVYNEEPQPEEKTQKLRGYLAEVPLNDENRAVGGQVMKSNLDKGEDKDFLPTVAFYEAVKKRPMLFKNGSKKPVPVRSARQIYELAQQATKEGKPSKVLERKNARFDVVIKDLKERFDDNVVETGLALGYTPVTKRPASEMAETPATKPTESPAKKARKGKGKAKK